MSDLRRTEAEARLVAAGIVPQEAGRLRAASRHLLFYPPFVTDDPVERRRAGALLSRQVAGERDPVDFLSAIRPILRAEAPQRRNRMIDSLVSPSANISIAAVCSLVRRAGTPVKGSRLCRDLAAMHGTADDELVRILRRITRMPEPRRVDAAGTMRYLWTRRLVRMADGRSFQPLDEDLDDVAF